MVHNFQQLHENMDTHRQDKEQTSNCKQITSMLNVLGEKKKCLGKKKIMEVIEQRKRRGPAQNYEEDQQDSREMN